MVDSNIVAPLLKGLRDRDIGVRHSTVDVIARLAQYGKVPELQQSRIYYKKQRIYVARQLSQRLFRLFWPGCEKGVLTFAF